MNVKEKLFKRLPKKYHCLVRDIVPEGGLVDDCKYMLYFEDGVKLFDYEDVGGYPVRSLTEAIQVLKECEMMSVDEMIKDIKKEMEKNYA